MLSREQYKSVTLEQCNTAEAHNASNIKLPSQSSTHDGGGGVSSFPFHHDDHNVYCKYIVVEDLECAQSLIYEDISSSSRGWPWPPDMPAMKF